MQKVSGDVTPAGNVFQKEVFVMECMTVMIGLMKQVGQCCSGVTFSNTVP